MGNILLEILENLKVVGLCSILLVLFRTADILFGIANANKSSILNEAIVALNAVKSLIGFAIKTFIFKLLRYPL